MRDVPAASFADFLSAFDAIPFGTHRGRFADRDWIVSRTAMAGGRAEKLLARELGGPGYVSLNVYRLETGPILKPCELPETEAIAFVTGLRFPAR